MSSPDDRRRQDADEFKGRTGDAARRVRLIVPLVVLVVVLALLAYWLAAGHIV